MGTEAKSNCYPGNKEPDVNRVKELTAFTTRNSIKNNGKYLTNVGTKATNSLTAALKVEFTDRQAPFNSEVPFVPIQIDENAVIEGAKEILRIIRPTWNLNCVQFKKFTDGITNKLVGCFYTAPNVHQLSSITNGVQNIEIYGRNSLSKICSDSGNLIDVDGNADAETESAMRIKTNISATKETTTESVVLVRVYGNKTDLLIDRKAETRNIKLLHSYGFAPTLYATFKNGLVYDFVPGVTLNTESVLRPEIWMLVAQRMADMHRLVKPNWNNDSIGKQVPMLWTKTQRFFDLVPEQFSDAKNHKRLKGTFLPISRMREEFAELYKRLETLGSPLVFAHNDLLLGNVIYTEDCHKVTFIDYEYADYNYQAFDIGNHFAEFAGVETVDYSNYPSREFQLKWLRVYLQSYLQRTQVSDAEVEILFVQVNQFALAAHFFWVIWCLIQAEHSTIDFDYVEYAFIRYNEYLAKKEQFLDLDLNLLKCKI